MFCTFVGMTSLQNFVKGSFSIKLIKNKSSTSCQLHQWNYQVFINIEKYN